MGKTVAGDNSGGVLVVDLNNFAAFPTLAVGILVASLRQAGFRTDVICPLAYGVAAREREYQETVVDDLVRRLHHATSAPTQVLRDVGRRVRLWWINRPDPRVLDQVARAARSKPTAVLVSAYLQHYPTVLEIGRLLQAEGIPLILGGAMFNIRDVADEWRNVPGLAAIVGAEADLAVPDIVDAVASPDRLLQFCGVLLPDGRRSHPAPPLRQLDRVPVPDFRDFPWGQYRTRVVPVMTGRGCQWARCKFCSDVVSANGRTFRTRSIESVLDEMELQAQRHDTSSFVFLDLKLNSNPAMLRGIAEHLRDRVPGAEWIGTVHVDGRRDNGLSRHDLQVAVQGGMRRISFGLESGSQRLLDAMDKDCSVERNSQFIRHSYEAGLSVRCTMFKGYPGESADDLAKTASFLERHAKYIDRVRYNDFSALEGTPIYMQLRQSPGGFFGVRVKQWDHRNARAEYVNDHARHRNYARANRRLLRAVHSINRRALRSSADAFDGLM